MEAIVVNVSAVPVLVTCTFCGVTAPPPVELNVIDVGVSVRFGVGGGAATTVKVTPTVRGLLVAAVDATVTEPV